MTRSRPRSKHLEALRLPLIRMSEPPATNAVELSRHAGNIIVNRALRADDRVSFGYGAGADNYLIGQGWHLGETFHRWTGSEASLFAFNAMFSAPAVLYIDILMMRERSWSDYDFSITLNGLMLPCHRTEENPDRILVSLDRPLRPAEEINIIGFHSKTVVVSDLIEGADARRIGIGVMQLWFETHAQA